MVQKIRKYLYFVWFCDANTIWLEHKFHEGFKCDAMHKAKDRLNISISTVLQQCTENILELPTNKLCHSESFGYLADAVL